MILDRHNQFNATLSNRLSPVVNDLQPLVYSRLDNSVRRGVSISCKAYRGLGRGTSSRVQTHLQTSSKALASSIDNPCDCNTADQSSVDRAVICVSARSSSQDRPTSGSRRVGDVSLPPPRRGKFVMFVGYITIDIATNLSDSSGGIRI